MPDRAAKAGHGAESDQCVYVYLAEAMTLPQGTIAQRRIGHLSTYPLPLCTLHAQKFSELPCFLAADGRGVYARI